MNFLKELDNRILIYDGSKGYLLQKLGLKGGECGELWNVTNPEAVKDVYRQYKEAGADIIQTNTFTGNRVNLDKYSLGDRTYELNYEGARLAREVASCDTLVAASIGPTGLMFEPYGELTFDYAYEVFKEQIKAVADGGVDIINFETFTDISEMRAALLAAKENTTLPVICSMAYEETGRTLMGTAPYVVVKILQSLGADMIGVNCSFGVGHMKEIVKNLYEASGGRLSVKPNAGLPEFIDGRTIYKETPENFSGLAAQFAQYGAGLIGGCCGTTPDYIKALKKDLRDVTPVNIKEKQIDVITSGTRYLKLSDLYISNCGKLDIRLDIEQYKEMTAGDFSGIEEIAQDISTENYDAILIDLNFVENDEIAVKIIKTAQGFIKAPLMIKTIKPDALDKILRIYCGVAGVIIDANNTGISEQLTGIANKYGSIVVGNLNI